MQGNHLFFLVKIHTAEKIEKYVLFLWAMAKVATNSEKPNKKHPSAPKTGQKPPEIPTFAPGNPIFAPFRTTPGTKNPDRPAGIR